MRIVGEMAGFIYLSFFVALGAALFSLQLMGLNCGLRLVCQGVGLISFWLFFGPLFCIGIILTWINRIRIS